MSTGCVTVIPGTMVVSPLAVCSSRCAFMIASPPGSPTGTWNLPPSLVGGQSLHVSIGISFTVLRLGKENLIGFFQLDAPSSARAYVRLELAFSDPVVDQLWRKSCVKLGVIDRSDERCFGCFV